MYHAAFALASNVAFWYSATLAGRANDNSKSSSQSEKIPSAEVLVRAPSYRTVKYTPIQPVSNPMRFTRAISRSPDITLLVSDASDSRCTEKPPEAMGVTPSWFFPRKLYATRLGVRSTK